MPLKDDMTEQDRATLRLVFRAARIRLREQMADSEDGYAADVVGKKLSRVTHLQQRLGVLD